MTQTATHGRSPSRSPSKSPSQNLPVRIDHDATDFSNKTPTTEKASHSPYRVGNWTVTKLRDHCRELNLSPVGKKMELIQRLEQHHFESNGLSSGTPRKRRGRAPAGSSFNVVESKETNPFQSRNASVASLKKLNLLSDYEKETSLIRTPSKRSLSRSSKFASTEDNEQKLWNPFKILAFFSMFCVNALKESLIYAFSHPTPFILLILLVGLAIGAAQTSGPHQIYLQNGWEQIFWYGRWMFLGILSSIGLGSGAHTFILFLGPHIAQVTTAAYVCKTTEFGIESAGRILCPPEPYTRYETISVGSILLKVLGATLAWGAGTAIGEIPPYLLARAAMSASSKATGYRREMKQLSERSSGLSIMDRLRVFVYRMITGLGFWGVLASASIPNPLFDLAGMTCGYFRVPFQTFILGTFVGKTFIKSIIQALFVIFLFSKDHLEKFLSLTRSAFPVIGSKLHSWFIYQRGLFQQRQVDIPNDAVLSSGSMITTVWNGLIFCMIAFFVFTAIQSTATIQAKKYYSRTANKSSR